MDAFLEALGASFIEFGPAYTMAIGIVAIAAWIAAKAMPFIREVQLKKLELEEARETRKSKEAQQLHDRERERDKLTAHMIETQDRSNNVVEALVTQMAAMNSALDESKHRSRGMGDKIDVMDTRLKEIQNVLVSSK